MHRIVPFDRIGKRSLRIGASAQTEKGAWS